VFSVEEVDLAALARALAARFGRVLAQGYLHGRTVLRDAVAAQLGCSLLEAEALVDTLEAAGYLRYPRAADATHPRPVARWEIRVDGQT
jgi:hypothetical protein